MPEEPKAHVAKVVGRAHCGNRPFREPLQHRTQFVSAGVYRSQSGIGLVQLGDCDRDLRLAGEQDRPSRLFSAAAPNAIPPPPAAKGPPPSQASAAFSAATPPRAAIGIPVPAIPMPLATANAPAWTPAAAPAHGRHPHPGDRVDV